MVHEPFAPCDSKGPLDTSFGEANMDDGNSQSRTSQTRWRKSIVHASSSKTITAMNKPNSRRSDFTRCTRKNCSSSSSMAMSLQHEVSGSKKTQRVQTQTQSCNNAEPQSFKSFLALRSSLPPPLPLSAACCRCARGHDSSSSRICMRARSQFIRFHNPSSSE